MAVEKRQYETRFKQEALRLRPSSNSGRGQK